MPLSYGINKRKKVEKKTPAKQDMDLNSSNESKTVWIDGAWIPFEQLLLCLNPSIPDILTSVRSRVRQIGPFRPLRRDSTRLIDLRMS